MQSVNVDPLNPHGNPSTEALRDLGVGGVRLVLRPDCLPYIEAMRAAGLGVLGVIANESGDLDQYVGYPITLLEVGNEKEGAGPSSWQMSASDYYGLWYLCEYLFPTIPRIIGGLVSGDVYRGEPYLAVQGAAAYGLHPYNKTASETASLIAAYREVTDYKPLLTEWNRPADQIAEYVGMIDAETLGGWHFCWHDLMVTPFGLIDAANQPKAEYWALREALINMASLTSRMEPLELQQGLTLDLIERVLLGKWDGATYGAESAEALLRSFSPKYADHVSVPFPSPEA